MTQPKKATEKTAMIQVLRRIAGELGTTSVSRREFLRRGGPGKHKMQRLFGS
jgi:hypothetical protein